MKDEKNPYPGLRPFNFDESHLYFGREDQIEEVLDKLTSHNFVAIVGTSGIGKSSFINCGILPILLKGHRTKNEFGWDIYNFRPGNSPFQNMAESLCKDEINDIEEDQDLYKKLLETTEKNLQKKTSNLVEFLAEKYKKNKQNILIYIDQFEEIFRFKSSEEDNVDLIDMFLNLLLVAIGQNKVPISVAITMRSDFVGECARYPTFTEKINNSQFLIPQMTREEKKRAIVKPIEVFNGSIDNNLVQKILDDVGDKIDALPVMQHALMRTYDYWDNNSYKNDPVSFIHYEAIGGMEKALSIHANEVFGELNEHQQILSEKIFKTITEKGDGGRGTRRPTKLIDVATITNATVEEVELIVDHFRASGRTLLMPPHDVPLSEESMVDISHESLMRIWNNLSEWVDDEFESAKIYLRLCEASEMHQLGKGGLWRPPDLQLALAWLNTHNPSLSWGLRYHAGYERAMLFLDYSEKEHELKLKNEQKKQKRRLFVIKVFMAIFALAGAVAFGFFLYGKKQTIIAIDAQKTAETAKVAADSAKDDALKSANVAKQQTIKALEAEREARRSAELAEIARGRADTAKLVADTALTVADDLRHDTFRQRLISISKSMAIKSLQIADTTKKGLIAQQAYKFNIENGGDPQEPDIYNGLYYAVKQLKGNSFNQFSKHRDNVRVIAQIPDQSGRTNKVYSTGSDGRILLWDVDNKVVENNLQANAPNLINKAMALSPNKQWLVCGGDYSYLQLFDLSKPNQTKPLIISNDQDVVSILYLAFISDKQFVSAGSDKRILLWKIDGDTVLPPEEIKNSDSKINAIAINGNTLAIAKSNGQLTLIDIATREEKQYLFPKDKSSQSDIISVTFGQRGNTNYLAAGNEKGYVHVWNLSDPNSTVLISNKHSARVNNIKFSADGTQLATGSFDATVRIWDTNNFDSPPIVLTDHEDWVWSIEFSPNGEYLLAGCRDFKVRMWPTKTNSMVNEICGRISRNMSLQEWEDYVADTTQVRYQLTCSNFTGLNP